MAGGGGGFSTPQKLRESEVEGTSWNVTVALYQLRSEIHGEGLRARGIGKTLTIAFSQY